MPHASKLRVFCARQLYTAESHVMSLGKLHHTALLSLLDFYIVNKQIVKYRYVKLGDQEGILRHTDLPGLSMQDKFAFNAYCF